MVGINFAGLKIYFILILVPLKKEVHGALRDLQYTTGVEKTFSTYLDHFNPMDNRKIHLRYVEYNFNRFAAHRPLLIEIGTQEGLNEDPIINNPSYKIARFMSATLLHVEHRFYGKSIPRGYNDRGGSESYKAYLPLLTVEQALEDLVDLIVEFKANRSEVQNNTVGVFGCGYAGTLATWLRYKFPHLVDAVWASGAPLIARATEDYKDFYLGVKNMYEAVDAECFHTMSHVFNYMVAHQTDKLMELATRWSCSNSDAGSKEEAFYSMELILYYPYQRQRRSIAMLCDLLRLHNSSSGFFIEDFIALYSYEACPLPISLRDVFVKEYQACTQLGFLSMIPSTIFKICDSFPLSLQIERLRENIDRLDTVYGFTKTPDSHIFSLSGSFDPWFRGQTSKTVDNFNYVVEEMAKCGDYEEPYVYPQAEFAIKNGTQLMLEWLKFH